MIGHLLSTPSCDCEQWELVVMPGQGYVTPDTGKCQPEKVLPSLEPGCVAQCGEGDRRVISDTGSSLSQPCHPDHSHCPHQHHHASHVFEKISHNPEGFSRDSFQLTLTHPSEAFKQTHCTNFHMVPPGWSGLSLSPVPVSWSVSCCKLLLDLPGHYSYM